MKILILGGGGREHALSWIISKSPLCSKLYISPGNAGTLQLGENIFLDFSEFSTIRDFVISEKIDLVIVGPEDPIVNGISDYFAAGPDLKNIPILAPSAKGAQLEGSKDFAKGFMKKYEIPTARYQTFMADQYEEAKEYLNNHKIPVVIKADGLAAGKGVTVCFNLQEALNALDEVFIQNRFGKAGAKVVIEEYLSGIEVSVFILTDGKNYVFLPEAKDYKRIGEGDTGPNTGGMGTVSPVPFADELFMEKAKSRIIEPTIRGLQSEGIQYKGFVFFGLMNVAGDPYVIEYNVRMGDPEAEVIIPRIDEDFLPLLLETAQGNLKTNKIKIKNKFAVTVMAVSGGYPGNFEKGKEIKGIDMVKEGIVFHAGTKLSDSKLLTSGGRVLCVTAVENSLELAIAKAYAGLDKIHFEGMYWRRDIGQELLPY
jgi:phosphoribosylamine---glycine ligase